MKENLLLLKDSLEPYRYMIPILKNMYIDTLDDIVNKLTLVNKIMMKILNLKLVIL